MPSTITTPANRLNDNQSKDHKATVY